MTRFRHAHRRRFVISIAAFALLASGCGGGNADDGFDPDSETFETFLNSVLYDYDGAASLDDLAERSKVVTEATLTDVEDGRIFGESPDDPAASRTLNLVFDAIDGARYYVEIPRPADSSVDRLREVFPIGARSVIYLQPNNDPPENWFNAREDGNQWFFTTPQGWIVEIAKGEVIVPFASGDNLGFAVPPMGESELDVWLATNADAESTK